MSAGSSRIVVSPDGMEVRFIYDDALASAVDAMADEVETRRASHVEPDGREWSVDLSPVGGPFLRGYPTRASALAAEHRWLTEHDVPKPRS